MSINQFMKTNLVIINDEIISNIPNNDFDSHQFIRSFAKRFEIEYVEFLSKYSEEPFRKVNAQIGKFLSENTNSLEIIDEGFTKSPNIFGVESQNEKWTKKNN